jgi:DNA-binding CsgD family transcriptional regulator
MPEHRHCREAEVTAKRFESLDQPQDPLRPVSPDQLAALRATFKSLRQDGRQIIGQIRDSLDEMRQLRARLLEQRTAAARAAGLNGPPRSTTLQSTYGFTPRELQVAMLLASGRSNVAIAAALRISPHTARHHTQRVLAKLGVHSRAAAGALLRG